MVMMVANDGDDDGDDDDDDVEEDEKSFCPSSGAACLGKRLHQS